MQPDRMRYLRFVGLSLSLLVGLQAVPGHAAQVASQERAQEAVGPADVGAIGAVPGRGYVRVTGTSVALVKPEGFRPAERFPGFQQDSTGASIMVTELGGPADELIASLSPEALQARGMTQLHRQAFVVDGQSRVLFQVAQDANGIPFLKWLAVFGDDAKTVIVAGTFPTEHEKELSPLLRDVVSTARWPAGGEVDQLEGVPFTIEPVEPLKFALRLGHMLTFSVGGAYPLQSDDDPMLVVGYAISDALVENKADFARQRLAQIEKTKIQTVERHEPIEVDGLTGFESIATGRHTDSDVPVVAYQVMLYDDESYVIVQGLVGEPLRAKYLPVFARMAKSFKRKAEPSARTSAP